VVPVERRIERDGVPLVLWEWPGDPPPTLLLHGIGNYGRYWDLFARAVDGRLRLVAPDARGHGDLYVLLRVQPHPVFQRDGANLLLEYPIHISQAALGTDVDVPTLNGHVSMKIPPGTQSGTVFRVRQKGLPDVHDGRTGDLLVRVTVETPTNLNSAQRRWMEELGTTLGTEVHPSQRSFLEKIKRLLR